MAGAGHPGDRRLLACLGKGGAPPVTRDRTWLGRAARPLLLAVASLALACTPANGQPPFVAGDLIVKFRDGDEAGQVVARAMRADQPLPEVAPVAARLSAELGLPLVATRVTSGRELVLGIDRDRLAQALRERLARDPAVRGVTPIAAPKTVLPAAQVALAVELAPNTEAERQVREAARAGHQSGPGIDALVARMAGGADPRPAGRVTERGELVVAIDVAALTRELVERLKRRPDVEYAQVSQIVRPFGGAK
jgi:hypothetical protein